MGRLRRSAAREEGVQDSSMLLGCLHGSELTEVRGVDLTVVLRDVVEEPFLRDRPRAPPMARRRRLRLGGGIVGGSGGFDVGDVVRGVGLREDI